MLRTALRPASLGLLALMLAAATAFALLGHWQLDRAKERAAPQPTEHVVPIQRVLAPAEPFTGRADHQRVRVRGAWVAADTVLVPRALDGREGADVVAALRVTGGGGRRGGLLPVVRGWVPAGTALDSLPRPPGGAVSVSGRLLDSEAPQGVSGHRVRAVSSADLLTLWGPPLYTGFVVEGSAPSGLRTVPAPAPARHWDLQNLSYAFQWWLFALFAVALWGKTVRDRHAADLAAAADEAAEAAEAAEDGAAAAPWEDGHLEPRPSQEVRS